MSAKSIFRNVVMILATIAVAKRIKPINDVVFDDGGFF